MRPPLLILTGAILLAIPGCAPNDPPPEALAAPGPLPFDPTEQHTLAEWWTDGEQLLQLGPNGVFARHDGLDRYHAPAERGRWSRQSYAALWLEPYTRKGDPRRRLSITKIDGHIRLDPGAGAAPMWALPGPPESMEDRLLGRWAGPAGRLRLDSTLRYELRLPADRPAQAAEVSGYTGTWRVAEDILWLRPDSPLAAPMQFDILSGAGEIVLAATGGRLFRDGGK